MTEDQKSHLEREVDLANMGRQVVSNEAFKYAMTSRKAQIFDTFCKTNKDQADIREEAWRTMKNIMSLEQYFETLLITGKMAESTLKSTEKE